MSGPEALNPSPAASQIESPTENESNTTTISNLKEDAGAAVALAERATLLANLGDTTQTRDPATAAESKGNGQSDQFARFQIDAPSCDNCGSITVRNGNCYLCHNCGNRMGCS